MSTGDPVPVSRSRMPDWLDELIEVVLVWLLEYLRRRRDAD